MPSVIAKERMFTYESGMTTARNVIILKQPTTATIGFDLNHKLDSGLTISTGPITQVDNHTALTIGTVDIRNEEVSAPISGWETERRYRLRCTANLSDSSVVVVEGVIEVIIEDGDATVSWQSIPSGGDALMSNPLSQFAATTSAQLAGVISDETGSGALVFGTSPTLVTPALGTPLSGNLSNCTAYESINLASTGEAGGIKFLREDGDGTVSWQAIAGGGDALTANPLSQFAATTSLQLLGVMSDETGTGALVFATNPVLVTPALGTPSSGTLTSCTGLPISTGVSGLGTGVATFLATPSSANLAAAVTGETGTGALVFATSPSLVTPALGTPASGTLTSCTGLPLSTGITGDLPFANLTPATAASRILGRGSAGGSGDFEELTVASGVTISGTAVQITQKRTVVASFALALGTAATTGANKTNELLVPYAGTIVRAAAVAKTGPTGAALIFDINLNGTSIWAATQANRIQIAAAATEGTQSSFDTTAVAQDDNLSVDIDQIGSSVAGQDITVQLTIELDW